MELREYSSHVEYMANVAEAADARQAAVEQALKAAFSGYISQEPVEIIAFGDMTVIELAAALSVHPLVLKPLLAACNVAARAIERDIGIRNLNTYLPRLSDDQATAIAGYLKPFLPLRLTVPGLCHLDRVGFIDKEVRLRKGRWESKVKSALQAQASRRFVKRRFIVDDNKFEIDAATPPTGPISLGVDIKRIEARRDIHKRTDEIVRKAVNLRKAFPDSRAAAVVYYPFVDEQVNIQSRLQSPEIEAVAFAGKTEESIALAVGLVLAKLGVRK
jgi:hypothetical protein